MTEKEIKTGKGKSRKKDFHRPVLIIFASYFKSHMGLFLLDMLCALCVAGIDVAFPLISRYSMYELLPNQAYKFFFVLMSIVGCSFIIRAGLNFIITYLGHMFGACVETDIRGDLYNQFQKLEFDFFDENRTGKLMNRLTGDLFEVTELAHHGPEDLLISFVTVTGAMIVMFSIQWKLALIVAVILPIFACIVMICRKSFMDTSKAVKLIMADINAEIESSLSGMKTSKAFDNSEVDRDRFAHANRKYRDSKGNYYRSMAYFNASLEFFVCILQVAVIAFGGYLIMRRQISYIDLITFTLYISAFISPIRRLGTLTEIFISGFAGLNRFVEVMRLEPSLKEPENPEILGEVQGRISIKDVTFSYKNNADVLDGVSLEIPAGETLAVVGHSGGGKSTLCQLIPRFYDVTSGSISIDGHDVRSLSKSTLRQNVGIVQQEVFLFAATVFENIRYGKPSATEEEVFEAARKAEIFDEIMEMPRGFDTYVGERGTLLSGGQKQRIAIARIFLKNPPILILDEATSALDSITEESIRQAFSELSKGRTTIMIAHRLASIKEADRVALIEEGKVCELGSHEELMEKNGRYAELYHAQRLE